MRLAAKYEEHVRQDKTGRFCELVITHNFARNECSHSQPASAG